MDFDSIPSGGACDCTALHPLAMLAFPGALSLLKIVIGMFERNRFAP